MQIISLFHHLLFIIYKRLFSNTRTRFKGPSQKKLHYPVTKTELNAVR